MFKKVLSTTVLGISALGVMAANAAAPGIYVTGQLGYANTHMGNKTNIKAISNNLPKLINVYSVNPNDKDLANNGLAGRIALGYQFNQNFAVEAGYLRLGQTKVAANGNNHFIKSDGTLKLQQNVVDFLAKGIVPICNKFNLYGKAGLAYINTNLNYTEKADSKTKTDLSEAANVNRHKLAPEVALGVSYDITPNVSIDTSWTHIQAVGKNRPGNIDFVAVGLGYNFG